MRTFCFVHFGCVLERGFGLVPLRTSLFLRYLRRKRLARQRLFVVAMQGFHRENVRKLNSRAVQYSCEHFHFERKHSRSLFYRRTETTRNPTPCGNGWSKLARHSMGYPKRMANERKWHCAGARWIGSCLLHHHRWRREWASAKKPKPITKTDLCKAENSQARVQTAPLISSESLRENRMHSPCAGQIQ